MRGVAVAALLAVTSVAHGSPGVPLDDPAYEELAALRSRGLLAPFSGGLRPLTEARIRELLGRAPAPDGFWFRPIDRATVLALLHHDEPRTYTTAIRPRDVAGSIVMSCERTHGRPCGDGAGLVGELTTSAGYGDRVSATVALRAVAGSERYEADAIVDRAYVNARLGPLALAAGRDVLVVGPAARTQVAWGAHAPPVDLVRIGTAAPYDLAGPHGDTLRGSVHLALARMRGPQTYPGTLVGLSRFQLDFANTVEFGGTHMLQFNGDGAVQLGVIDFILEHFRRKQRTADEGDSSNRRFSADVAVRIAALHGARVYYEVAFEDVRKYFHHAIRHEADHLLGLELLALGACNMGITVELQKTGYRSHEHTPRTTGFTNRGNLVGSPLGPDTYSLFAMGKLAVGGPTLYPWIEAIRFANDTYTPIEFGPLTRTTSGLAEKRYRAGARLRVPLRADLRLDLDAMIELTDDFAYVDGARQTAGGITAGLTWSPAQTPVNAQSIAATSASR